MANETGPPDAPHLDSLKYLTVQDMLWINLQVSKKVQHFNYAWLEEATFYQYGYRSSRDLGRQAARFLTGFMRLRPFTAGNEATAFIGFAAFLLMNGKNLYLEDVAGAEWVDRVRTGRVKVEEEIPAMLVDEDGTHNAVFTEVRDAVVEVLQRFPITIGKLSAGSGEKLAS